MISWAKSTLLLLAFGTVTVTAFNDWTLPEAFTNSDAYIHPGCIDNLNDLHSLESIANTTIHRTYTLCGGARSYHTNSITYNFKLSVGQRPLTARPNLYIKCGEDGATSNQCILKGGDILLDVTEYWGVRGPATNVIFQGIKFSKTNKYQVWGTKPGDITFVACQFRDAEIAKAQVLLDYNPLEGDNSGDELKMNFIECIFKKNKYAGTGNFASIITVNGRRNSIEIVDSEFKHNDFKTNNTNWERNSQLIESSGTVNITSSCFFSNNVGVSQIVSYGSPVFSQRNYNVAGNEQTKCFLSNFDSSERFKNFDPNCVEATETRCTNRNTRAPSSSPIQAPTASLVPSPGPTKLPTLVPTAIPTMTRSANPSISTKPSVGRSTVPLDSPSSVSFDSLSTIPSDSPSHMPSDSPSTMPSDSPSTRPSDSPSNIPSGGPSYMPSDGPSTRPSDSPSTRPSDSPSNIPSGGPSHMPSDSPSANPTTGPSVSPTVAPTKFVLLGPREQLKSDTGPFPVEGLPGVTMQQQTNGYLVIRHEENGILWQSAPRDTSINATHRTYLNPDGNWISRRGTYLQWKSQLHGGTIKCCSDDYFVAIDVVENTIGVYKGNVHSIEEIMWKDETQPFSVSLVPSPGPTKLPTLVPTAIPTMTRSANPSISTKPSVGRSTVPLDSPSSVSFDSLSTIPSDSPSYMPSYSPSTMPSDSPSNIPSGSLSHMPSDGPSANPTTAPSVSPTVAPTTALQSKFVLLSSREQLESDTGPFPVEGLPGVTMQQQTNGYLVIRHEENGILWQSAPRDTSMNATHRTSLNADGNLISWRGTYLQWKSQFHGGTIKCCSDDYFVAIDVVENTIGVYKGNVYSIEKIMWKDETQPFSSVNTTAPSTTTPLTTAPTMTPTPVPTTAPPTTFPLTPTASLRINIVFNSQGDPPNPLGLCEGDCDNDNHCNGDLICYHRYNSNERVPGCDGGEDDRTVTDYCIRE